MEVKITRKPQGYFELTIDGKFIGNYDTFKEAVDGYYEEIGGTKDE